MISKILVPIDGSALSKKATQKAVELAGQLDATIVIAHIMDQKNIEPYAEQEKNAQDIIKEMVDYVMSEDVAVESMLLFGSPEYDIEKVARKSEADMIVLATHGFGLKSKLLGSFSNAVVKYVKLPIVLIKE